MLISTPPPSAFLEVLLSHHFFSPNSWDTHARTHTHTHTHTHTLCVRFSDSHTYHYEHDWSRNDPSCIPVSWNTAIMAGLWRATCVPRLNTHTHTHQPPDWHTQRTSGRPLVPVCVSGVHVPPAHDIRDVVFAGSGWWCVDGEAVVGGSQFLLFSLRDSRDALHGNGWPCVCVCMHAFSFNCSRFVSVALWGPLLFSVEDGGDGCVCSLMSPCLNGFREPVM